MDIFKRRLPARKDMFIVLSVTVFTVFSWSIRGFLYVLPSILLRYAVMEILAIFFYMMAFALLESLLITGSLIVASAVLPGTWFREDFSNKGFLIILVGSTTSVLYQSSLGIELPDKGGYLPWLVIPLLIMVGLSLLAHFVRRLQVVLQSIAERFTVFVYLYIPIGVLGLVVVIFRNLHKG